MFHGAQNRNVWFGMFRNVPVFEGADRGSQKKCAYTREVKGLLMDLARQYSTPFFGVLKETVEGFGKLRSELHATVARC